MRTITTIVAMSVLFAAACGGSMPPFQSRPETVAQKACLDGAPCPEGMQPWVLGGTDCRNPTPEVIAEWQARGFFTGATADDVVAKYREKGVVLAFDADLSKCDRHVLLGGNCLVPPRPGSPLWLRIMAGEASPATTASAQGK